MVSPYRIQSHGTLAFFDSHFTVSTTTERPTKQFIRYRVDAGGSIDFTSYIFSIPEYSLINKVSYACQINNGVNFSTI